MIFGFGFLFWNILGISEIFLFWFLVVLFMIKVDILFFVEDVFWNIFFVGFVFGVNLNKLWELMFGMEVLIGDFVFFSFRCFMDNVFFDDFVKIYFVLFLVCKSVFEIWVGSLFKFVLMWYNGKIYIEEGWGCIF